MPITYQLNSDPEIHDRVKNKHRLAIAQLKQLNFAESYFFGETVQALGFSPLGFSGFFGTLIALFNEVARVEGNLNVSIFNLVMTSRAYATYSCPFGLGIKFYTAFTDGTCIISANFDSPAINDPAEKIYKIAAPRTVEATWLDHQRWVDQLSSDGKPKSEHLSFESYLRLARREDDYMLRAKNRIVPRDALSSVTSMIISIGLLVTYIYLFMLPPVLAHYMYPACWFVRNMNKPTLAENILIVITSFVVSWFLARFQKMPFIMEGAGTKFFGQSPSPDGRGYISTKWLVFVLIPMVPVRSYQIIEQYPGGQNSASVVMVPLERLAWFQVRETMWKSKVGYIIAVLVMFGFGVLPFWKCI